MRMAAILILGALACLLISTAPLGAQDDPAPQAPGPRAALRERLIAKFDANADGVLDEQEREQARQALRERFDRFREVMRERLREKAVEKFDADGDGRLGQEERARAREAIGARLRERWAAIKQRFDRNGDGRLGLLERLGAWRAIRRHAQHGQRPQGAEPGGDPGAKN